MWYAIERNENLSMVNAKSTHHLNRDKTGDINCFPCIYTSYWFTTEHYNKDCAFCDSNIPFVFYKPDQSGVHSTN